MLAIADTLQVCVDYAVVHERLSVCQCDECRFTIKKN